MSITALGTTAGGAQALFNTYNVITACTTSNHGVLLPATPTAGQTVEIVLFAAATCVQLNIYPGTGVAIDQGTSGTAVFILPGSTITVTAATSTQWYTTMPPVFGQVHQIDASYGPGGVGLVFDFEVYLWSGVLGTPASFAVELRPRRSRRLATTLAAATHNFNTYNVITGGSGSANGVKLPIAAHTNPGMIVVVTNQIAFTVNVWPASGGQMSTALARARR